MPLAAACVSAAVVVPGALGDAAAALVVQRGLGVPVRLVGASRQRRSNQSREWRRWYASLSDLAAIHRRRLFEAFPAASTARWCKEVAHDGGGVIARCAVPASRPWCGSSASVPLRECPRVRVAG